MAGAAAIAAVLPGCGGGGTGGGNNQYRTYVASGEVDQSEIGGNGLQVVSAWQQSAAIDGTGKFTTLVSARGSQILSLLDEFGKPRALAVSLPSAIVQPIKRFDAENTILALLFLSPGVFASSSQEASNVLDSLRALPPFDETVSRARVLLPTLPLSDALADTELSAKLEECISAWISGRGRAFGRGIDVGPGKDGFAVEVSIATDPRIVRMRDLNGAWRYLRIHRRELNASGAELQVVPVATKSANGLMLGAVGLSWGSLLTGTFGSPTQRLEAATTNYTQVAKSEYWIEGPGFAAGSPLLPATVPSDPGEAWGASFALYVLIPLIDCLVGLGKTVSEGLQAASAVWAAVKENLSLSNLILACNSGNSAGVTREIINLLVIILGGTLLAAVLVALGVAADTAAIVAALILGGFSLLFGSVNILQFVTMVGRYRAVEKIEVIATGNGTVIIR